MATRSGSAFDRVARTRSAGAWIISGVGVSLAGLTIWYLLVIKAFHLQTALEGGAYVFFLEMIELALLAGFSIVLIYAGYWLAGSRFDDSRVWQAGMWTLIGFTGIVTILTFAHSLQLVQGYRIPEPTVIQMMLLVAGAGALAGLLIGVSTLQETAEAERARRQRDTIVFVNDLLRHNVLNGMQVINGNTAMLEEHVDQEGRGYLETTQDRADRIVDLVQNVRVLTQSLCWEIEDRPVDLEELLVDVVAGASSKYPSAAIDVSVREPVIVRADDLLEPVFTNLVSNAVDHNDQGTPRVTLTLDIDGDDGVVTVADNGPGIPQEKREQYFEPGVQDESSVGQGIGLYLVQTLVQRYGGTVEVTDNDPRGARFAVRLPRADRPRRNTGSLVARTRQRLAW